MKRCVFLISLLFSGQVGAQSVDPTSMYFEVSDYYYPSSSGDYVPYKVAGFAQPIAPNIKPSLYILPSISVLPERVRYFAKDGTALEADAPADQVGLISIQPTVASPLPTQIQTPAVGAALSGLNLKSYLPAALHNGPFPLMFPGVQIYAPAAGSWINQRHAEHSQSRLLVDQAAARYQQYTVQAVSPQGATLKLLVAGDEVAARSYPGSLSGSLGQLYVVAPTQFTVNQVRAGNYELLVAYTFNDSTLSYIDASFDASQAISFFLDEARNAVTKSRSSGFQVFGLGWRRSKMATTLHSTMTSDTHVATMQNTKVVVFNADAAMIAAFEKSFFPSASKQDVIDSHLAAAEKAHAEGHEDLAAIHRKYADAIVQSNQLAEVDSVAAAAALAAGDWVGFVASGVRAIDSNDSKSDTFRRVIDQKAWVQQGKSWAATKQYPAKREVTTPVALQTAPSQNAYVGICGSLPNFPYFIPTPYGMQPRQGLLLTCVEEGSPAATSGLMAGAIVLGVNGAAVSTSTAIQQTLAQLPPGDTLSLQIFTLSAGATPLSQTFSIATRRGPPSD